MKLFLRLLLIFGGAFLMTFCCSAQQTNQPALNTNSLPHINKGVIRLMKARLRKEFPSLSTDEQSRRETMIKLYEAPECYAYLAQISSTISQNSSACDSSACPKDTFIKAKYILHQSGSISDITISGNTNAPIAPCLIQSIKSSSSSQQWPEKMRSIVGTDTLEMGFEFGFNLTPPGLN